MFRSLRYLAGVRVNKCKDITVNFRVNRVLSRRLSTASRPSSRMPTLFSVNLPRSPVPRVSTLTLAHGQTRTMAVPSHTDILHVAEPTIFTVYMHTCPPLGLSDHGTCVARGLACYRALATLLGLASRVERGRCSQNARTRAEKSRQRRKKGAAALVVVVFGRRTREGRGQTLSVRVRVHQVYLCAAPSRGEGS